MKFAILHRFCWYQFVNAPAVVRGRLYSTPPKKKSFCLYNGPPTKPPKLLKRRKGFSGWPRVTACFPTSKRSKRRDGRIRRGSRETR